VAWLRDFVELEPGMMVREEEDLADLFAIPDFWRPCNWLDMTIRDINKQNPLFEIDVTGKFLLLLAGLELLLRSRQRNLGA